MNHFNQQKRAYLVRIVRTNTLLINVSLTDTPFNIHLAHLVGEGVEWVYW